VRFDDRLLTVLNLPPGDRHDTAVRWRQLVDLVARAGPNSSSPAVAAALDSIRSEASQVDDRLRAAAARAVAALPLPLGLLEYFAADKLEVSAPVLAAATLDPEQWRALAELADDEGRRFIETLHPDSAGHQPGFTETLVESEPAKGAAPAEESAPSPAGPSLSEVVARIERRRRHRAATTSAHAAAIGAIPGDGQSPGLFRWECGPSGEILWVEGAPRGPLIGRSIAKSAAGGEEGVDAESARAFGMRAPFRDAALRVGGEGPVAGAWKISGVPAFEPRDGRFAGYRGIALREAVPVQSSSPIEFLADPDSLRELVHEIKTPLNAIIGFAEIIDGQLLGPADRRYRERAVEIVAQAQLLLAAIDDLDFAGKVHASKHGALPRVDLAELVDHGAPSLVALAAKHGAQLEIARAERACIAAVEPELADRLLARLVSALAEHAAPGETLRLSLDRGDMCRVAIARPAALRGLSDAILFGAQAGTDGHAPAPNGDSFTLRLIRGLARIAGGDLVASRAGLALVFPTS
jgi:hypothetical protein